MPLVKHQTEFLANHNNHTSSFWLKHELVGSTQAVHESVHMLGPGITITQLLVQPIQFNEYQHSLTKFNWKKTFLANTLELSLSLSLLYLMCERVFRLVNYNFPQINKTKSVCSA